MSSKKRVCVVGHFGFGQDLLNGQTIKTKVITAELEKRLGADQVIKIDTHGGARALLRVVFQLISAMSQCRNLILFPAQNGVRVLVPILAVLNHVFHRGLLYVVIGGWLEEMLCGKRFLTQQLKRFDGVYVETTTMKRGLEKLGLSNIVIMPNCKDLRILDRSGLIYAQGEPYRLCTFSRVMREKGIEDAVGAVRAINAKYGRTVCKLDIFGKVEKPYAAAFEMMQARFDESTRYMGAVDFDASVETLKPYYMLLFPTKFYTEGIPGTIIDAFSAGVPVLSAEWESCFDIMTPEVGITYEFGNEAALEQALEYAVSHSDTVHAMKPACLAAAEQYTPGKAIEAILAHLM